MADRVPNNNHWLRSESITYCQQIGFSVFRTLFCISEAELFLDTYLLICDRIKNFEALQLLTFEN